MQRGELCAFLTQKSVRKGFFLLPYRNTFNIIYSLKIGGENIKRKVKPVFVIVCVAIAVVVIALVIVVSLAFNSSPSTANSDVATTESTETTVNITYEVTTSIVKWQNKGNYTFPAQTDAEVSTTAQATKSTSSNRVESYIKVEPTEKPQSEVSNNNSSSNHNTQSNHNSNNNYNPPEQETKKATQKPTPTTKKPEPQTEKQPEPTEKEDDIYLSYSSISVNTEDVIFLTLIGAENGVSWSVNNSSVLQNFGGGGNQCSFKAVSKGTATVTASYNNRSYTCNVTVN